MRNAQAIPALLLLLAQSASAQTAPTAEPVAAPPVAPAAPAPTAIGEPAPAEATAPPSAPAVAPSTTPAATPAPVPQTAADVHVQALIAQARANARPNPYRARRVAVEREPDPVYGDAGAAIAIGLSLDMPWYTDEGYDVFAEDNVANRFGVWAAYDLFALREDTFAAVELGYGYEFDESELLRDTLQSDLTTHALHAGMQIRWVPVDFLQPHARLALGAARVDMNLRTDFPAERFEDGGISPFASLGLGFTLRTPTRTFESRRGKLASLSFGVMLEGGYTLAGPLSLQLDGEGPDDREIALTEADLGELNRSGPYARVSLVGRF